MKLYLNTASPYARLARVLLIETDLAASTELVDTDPWTAADAFWSVNPAGKVPALVLDDGTTLIESACIADHLIAVSGRSDLAVGSRPNAAGRLQVLGLARAAMDCAFGAVTQQHFGESGKIAERWLTAVPRIAARLDAVNDIAVQMRPSAAHDLEPARCDLADLTLAVAFGYVRFRLPQIDWETNAPRLAEWIEFLEERASLALTRPQS